MEQCFIMATPSVPQHNSPRSREATARMPAAYLSLHTCHEIPISQPSMHVLKQLLH
jgi:hypothetical protein